MQITVKLADADRERFDCAEKLTLDPYSMSIREAIVLQKGVEVAGVLVAFDSPAAWRLAVNTKRHEDGTVETDWTAELVLVWLALRRSGVNVDLSDVDYDSDRLQYWIDTDPADVGEPGKDPSSPETTS